MWNKPWNLKEGVAIVAGLLLVGLLLQFSIGPLDWVLFLWPANGITLIVLIIALILFYLLRKKVYFFRFMMTMQAAIPAIAASALLTIIMGLSRQVPAEQPTSSDSARCWTSGPSSLFIFGWQWLSEKPQFINSHTFHGADFPWLQVIWACLSF